MAYRVQTHFAHAQRSILPLVVESKLQEDGRRRFVGYGSGFLVGEDALVTAYHVIVNAVDIKTTLPNGKRLSLDKAWVVDPLRDVAILYIEPDEVREAELKPLPIAARDFRSSGHGFEREPEIVFTSGWPAGVQRSQAGILFAVNQYYDREAIWLSSNFVRPGDSGGPLLNVRGEVIGVISYAMSGRRSSSDLLENVATSTDLRPALAQRLLRKSPHSIKRYTRPEYFQRNPHAMAAKVASVLAEFSDPRRRPYIGSIDPFLRDLDRAVDGNSPEARLYFLKGSVYHMLGEYDDAKVSYEQALDVSADHIPAAYSLAYCQLALRSYETAVELFTFIRQFEPYEHLAQYGLAQAELQLLNYELAVENLLQVIHVHPDFAPGLYLLGRAYVGAGEDAMAAQIHTKLEKIDRQWAELLQKTRFMTPFKPIKRYQMPEAKIRTLTPLR
jgi:S1-C subfamily serine protease